MGVANDVALRVAIRVSKAMVVVVSMVVLVFAAPPTANAEGAPHMKRDEVSAKLMGVESDVVLKVAINLPTDMVFVTDMVALVYAALPGAEA